MHEHNPYASPTSEGISRAETRATVTRTIRQFVGFLLLNLLAAYAPAAFWLPFTPGVPRGVAILVSPLLLVGLSLWIVSGAGICMMMAVFLTSIVLLSAGLCRSRIARFAIPFLLFSLSLAQGVVSGYIVDGLNAL
jgi:hypothetical protein